jgi:hypothetical protein
LRHQHIVVGFLVLAALCAYLLKADWRTAGDGDSTCDTEFAAPAFPATPRSGTAPAALDFARVTYAEAQPLVGKRVSFRLQITSEAMHGDNSTTLFSCRSEDRLTRSVSFASEQAPTLSKKDMELTVEGLLEIRFHDSWTIHGQVIPAYLELRIVDAKIMAPRSVEAH